jgi:hypothetical protein
MGVAWSEPVPERSSRMHTFNRANKKRWRAGSNPFERHEPGHYRLGGVHGADGTTAQ